MVIAYCVRNQKKNMQNSFKYSIKQHNGPETMPACTHHCGENPIEEAAATRLPFSELLELLGASSKVGDAKSSDTDIRVPCLGI